MDKRLLEKLASLDAFEKLERGIRGVRVSLQTQGPLPAGTRAERKACLHEKFSQLAETMKGARVDLDTVSVSAQTVEAVLPVDQYDELKQSLEDEGIRVDPVIDEQIV